MTYAVDQDRVTWDEIDGETLIINTETGYYFSLEGAGSAMWALLAQGEDEPAIVDRIVSEYDVAASTVRADLEGLIEALRGEELLIRQGGVDGEAV
jgi:hypothetical protein